jgi:hypothetical protein
MNVAVLSFIQMVRMLSLLGLIQVDELCYY